MTRLTRCCAALLLVAVAAPAFTQNASWKTHTDMQDIRDLARAGNDIWAATGGGVFVLRDRRTPQESYTKYTNIDGLASIDVRAIAVDANGHVLAGSSNGYLSILDPATGWSTVPDIARATDKPQRGINVLRTRGDEVYIGTDFGVSVYVPAQQRFKDSYLKFGSLPAQAQVLDILLLQDSIWVATDQGVAVADLRTPNLQDPAAWKAYTSSDGLLSSVVASIASFNGALYAGTSRGVSVLGSRGWSDAFPEAGDVLIPRMRVGDDMLYIMTKRRLLRSADGITATQVGDSLSADRYPGAPLLSSLVVGPGYILGSSRGIVTQGSTWVFEKPNGPNANVFQSLAVDARGRVWACSGRQGRGMYALDGDVWTTYSRATTPQVKEDDVQVAVAGPADDMWFGTWGGGIVHLKSDGSFEQFDNASVPGIPGFSSYPNYAIVPGIAMDPSGTMWFVHRESNTSTILSCRKTDGTWKFFDNQYPEIKYTKSLAIDGVGNKWFLSQENFLGALVFNDNGTFENASDDLWYKLDPSTFFATGPGVSGVVWAVSTDRIGDTWLGTTLGIRTVFNGRTPDKVYRPCYTTACNIEGQSVRCVAVDPVNNKWLGTEKSGVFVLSSDGTSLLAQYTTDNSPLIDNSITSIAIHPTTGVAYIGTDKGLSALTTPYVRASLNSSELRVSPNPFHPGIDEHVVIDGLAEGSTIKVFSASGNLIREIPTPGGRIGFWDGKNTDGDYASSGIYFVVAGTAEGAQTAIGKLAVVRK